MTDHKHEHEYGPVVAGYTEPGIKALTWSACRECGEDDPKNPRPDEAVDSPPEDDE